MADLRFHILVYLVLGLVSLSFGLIVYFRDRKNVIHQTFGLLNLGLVIWAFGCVIWLFQTNESSALFWTRVFDVGATLIPVFLLHWILAFLKKDKEKKNIILACYFITAFFLLFSFSSLYIKEVKPMLNFPYWPQAGIVYILYLILAYFGMWLYGLYQLILAHKKSGGNTKMQIKYIIFGTTLGLGGGAANFPLMLGFTLPFPPLNFLILAYPLIFACAMMKHELLGIKVILTEFLVFLVGVLLLTEIFLAPSLKFIIYRSGVLIVFGVISYFLIKSVLKEIKTREQLQELTQKLKKAYTELKKIDLAKSEFISIASHQLRTPLTTIRGYISLLLDGSYGKIDKEIEEALKGVYQNSLRLISLVSDLLDISRIEMGKMFFDFKEISLEDIVDDVIKDIKIIAEKKNLYLKWDKPEGLPKIVGDQQKLHQAILNIIDNAIKYTKEGGVTINIRYQKSGTKDTILFESSDTGAGIRKYELESIFKGFDRGDNIQKTHPDGVGLGLRIAEMIIEAHQGKIWAESEGEGKGSTFYIELPVG